MCRVPGPQGDVGPQGPPGPAGPPGNTSGGAVYVRWGRTTCPTGRELMYSGRAARSCYSQSGGGNNFQCFPDDPEDDDYDAGGSTYRTYVYGAEYQNPISALGSIHDHNVPCAVCYVPTRVVSLMIPAKLTCPTGWTEEYHGYLMAERHNHPASAVHAFECVDRNPESVPGSTADTNGGLFYHVEAVCDGLDCPPYVSEKEVTCVVCTK